MKVNSGKLHLLTTSENVGGNQLSSSKYEELLGILTDRKLIFGNHLLNIVREVNEKVHALARISKFIPQKKLRIAMKACFSSKFAYYSLIWMFHSRQINHKINKPHERALRIVYKYHFSLFAELFSKNKYVTVHQRILQILASEMYKILNGLSPDIMQDIFETKIKITTKVLVMRQHFPQKILKQLYGIQTIPYMAPKIWDLLPKKMKQVTTLNEFKAKIKIWKLKNCPYPLCRTYLPQTGLIT